jgi:hypothetical protein
MNQGRAEQIVAREPRERVCHEAFVIQPGRYRRVNSSVGLLSNANHNV